MGELVRYEVDDGIATVTLDSPFNRNALSRTLVSELLSHVREAFADDAVRVVVMTGAGPVFCSGADLKEQREGGEKSGINEEMLTLFAEMDDSPKPIVCRLNGPARAGGLGLVAASDIAIAPTSATFGFAEVRIGVLPAVISVLCVPRMSPRASLELFLTGENFGAERAVEVGLINNAVPDDQLDDEVRRFVDMLRRGGPLALAGIKPMIKMVRSLPRDEAFRVMAEESTKRFRSEEAAEGLAAFAEKRDPNWS